MDTATILGLAITLVKEGPAAISFVEQTYELFSGGTITAEQLQAMWQQAGTDVQTAKAKWDAAKS